jgi:Flp pilus assembly pilin Flp
VLKLFAYGQLFAVEAWDSLRRRQEGQTMTEYAVLLAVVTAAVVAALLVLSGNIKTVIEKIATYIKAA